MRKREKATDYNELINLADKILNLSVGITKDQFKDLNHRHKITGEVKLWLALLDLSLKDLEFMDNHDLSKVKIAKEALDWLEKESLTMDLVSESLDIASKSIVPIHVLRKKIAKLAKLTLEKGFSIT